MGNLNGDGFAAFSVLTTNQGFRLFIVPGGPAVLGEVAFLIVVPVGSIDDRTYRERGAGDVNGDGIADLVIDRTRQVYLILGRTTL